MQITDFALKKINQFLEQEKNKVFRISVSTGGCNGFSYKTEIGLPSGDDIILATTLTGGKTVTDSLSEGLLKNVVLDYEDSIGHSGFIFINPDASSTCGCGMSFDI